MSDLRVQIADIIVRKVLHEDYDDLVEGYLDEILLAADQIIMLPAYKAVAQAYYDRLASPVVPVGREEIARLIDPEAWADWETVRVSWTVSDSLAKADAIIAALGTKGADTGWRDIATAPRQEPVIVGHEKLKGWRRQAICNALGEWSFYDRPWLQQDPLDEAPTHWLAWPDGIPTDTGSEV